jgi:hypothetical protein
MHWNQIVDKVAPYIVKIDTPVGSGTGFITLCNENKNIYGIATAAHVVNYAEQWQQPIRIHFQTLAETILLKENDRIIFIDLAKDSAVIIFQKNDLKLPEVFVPLLPVSTRLSIGIEVGWLGFPAIAPYTLCFFSGSISAPQEIRNAYLIDGVAINGVSGGPVLYSTESEGVQIVGSITAYQANRQSGDTLPGLSIAQDVSHFHKIAAHFKSLDDAERKRQELEQEKIQNASPSPSPSPEIR